MLEFRYNGTLKKATSGSAAYDLALPPQAPPITIYPAERLRIPTAVYLELPEGYMGLVLSRSGLAMKHGIAVLNAPGLIDSDYRGEVGVILINHGGYSWTANPGDRIAQLLILPCAHVAPIYTQHPLTETERGAGGFGSTGVSS